jgi:CheY-like chemotaxis protein
MLGRVLRNLIENAVRYTQEGGVAVECARLPGRVQVRVVDTGVGIPRPDLERIWQEFEQLGNLQRDRAQGLGLGLPIVKRLASMLGLVVTVTSTPGLGSTFSIEVPLAPACIDNGGNACSGSAAPREGMTVLVVEDDETILEGLKAVLGGAGYAVTATQRADAAIGEVVRGMRPDLVVADYRLGEGGSGTDAIVGVRRTMGCDVPALLVTGELLGEPQTDANNYGFDLLHKPVDPDRLLDRMAELLS